MPAQSPTLKWLVPLALAAILLLAPVGPAQSPHTTENVVSSSTHIHRIERSLLPAAYIHGQGLPTMKLADRMKFYHVPGVSVAFIDHGRIAWARGYGMANVAEHKRVTTDTLFQAASISKSVAAFAALRLVQMGKLNLDEDVNRKLTSWKVPDSEFTKTEKVTLSRLLSHTSGMTVHGFAGYAAGEPVPTILQTLNGEKPANNEAIRVDRTPGQEFRYSGGGYVVVQLLLTDVAQKPFPELMHDLVLQPVAMTRSSFEQPLPNTQSPDAALPYDEHGNPVAGGWHTYPEIAAAGLWTTPSDLARFALEIEKAYESQSNLLSSDLAEQMVAYQSDEVYGLGVSLGERGRALKVWHSGANAGYRCLFEDFPDSGQGLVVMTNGENGLPLIGEIQRAIAQEYGWPDDRAQEHTITKIDPSTLPAFTGDFLFGADSRFIITQQNGSLYVQYPPFGDAPQQLFPESPTRFFMTSEPVIIDFQREPDGSVKKAELQNGPEVLEGERVSTSKP